MFIPLGCASGNKPGLGAMETAYIPHNNTLSVLYNTCTLLLNNEKYVNANLDAPDIAISGNGPSSEMLTCQSEISE